MLKGGRELREKTKKVDIKIFLIPLVVITVCFFAAGHMIINSIKNHYYNHLKEESINVANGYSHSLAKASEATDVVNQLLEEKLFVAGRVVVFYDGNYNNELLVRLEDILKVDEIDYYNSNGELIFSNMDELIGWKAYEGHPVHDFMISDDISRIDNIRQDVITGNYYKYGYFKVSNGGFIQIGVKAGKIHSFLDRFKIQQLINEMKDVEEISLIYFMDNDYNIIGSTDEQWIGEKFTNQQAKAIILKDEDYSSMSHDRGEKYYEVFEPIYFEGEKIGTIAIVQSLDNTEKIIRQVSIIGLIILVIIYGLVLFIMFSIYKKNGKLIRLAYFDSLTGLPNKQYLKEFINEELNKKENNQKAVLFINCSNFRLINLVYGYEYGDKLLKELSQKLRNLEDEKRTLFRFSADRFILYIKDYESREELVLISKEINALFISPVKVQEVEQLLDVQIGIVEIDSSRYQEIDRILKDASITLSYIKNNDSLNYAFFNEEMEKKLQREDLIEKEIRSILINNEEKKFYLEYQPQLDLKTNKVVCFEALARMKTSNLGFVSPVEFIEVAERKQLIVPLSHLILKIACHFLKTLNHKGFGSIKVAVNISGIQLLREDFIDTIMEMIKETDIEPQKLELEITESILLDNYEAINEKLKRLQDNKIEIALDDFGTGYSSFSRLRELNIDTVKIDRDFINRISFKEEDEIITGDIISMAHKLGLMVVAEGVELEPQKQYLINHECDIIQGYLFSKPLSEDNAIELIATNTI